MTFNLGDYIRITETSGSYKTEGFITKISVTENDSQLLVQYRNNGACYSNYIKKVGESFMFYKNLCKEVHHPIIILTEAI